MCNAWNHPPGCDCGWGGGWHAGASPGSSLRPFTSVFGRLHADVLRAHTNPNARCPHCDAQVFFYRSPHGGRIFFDELGPPWPKHACTDGSTVDLQPPRLRQPSWFSSGWDPLLGEGVGAVAGHPQCYAVSGLGSRGHTSFYVKTKRALRPGPMLVRTSANGERWVSLLAPYMAGAKAVELRCWQTLAECTRATADDWTRDERVDVEIYERFRALSNLPHHTKVEQPVQGLHQTKNTMTPSLIPRAVLDSNVLIAVLNVNDTAHGESRQLLQLLKETKCEILAPVLILWEEHAYRQHPEKSKAREHDVEAEVKLTSVDITSGLFLRTYSDAMVNVSGADRVFVSLAKDERVPLITNDDRVLKNASALGVQALSVGAFLRLHGCQHPLPPAN